MTFDAALNETILYTPGDRSSGPAIPSTWALKNSTWSQLNVTGIPSSRAFASLAYDPSAGRIVMFGGLVFGSPDFYSNETFEFDGRAWSNTTSAPSPSPRDDAAVTYDAGRGDVLLHGGRGLGTTAYDTDTWGWSSGRWSLVSASAPPGAGVWGDTSMTYDPSLNETVLVEVHNVTCAAVANDCLKTWAWSGSGWTAIASAERVAVADSGFATAWDPADDELLLFGGDTGTAANITLAFNGTAWNTLNATGAPNPRMYALMTTSTANQSVILFGGTPLSSGASAIPFGDTWQFKNRAWAPIAPLLTLNKTAVDVNHGVRIQLTTGFQAAPAAVGQSGLPSGCVSSNLLTTVCTPSEEGVYNVTSSVAYPLLAETARASLVVNPTLTLIRVVATVTTSGGQAQLSINVVTSGGTPPDTTAYTGLPSGCVSVNSISLTCSPNSTGALDLTVTVSDSDGEQVTGTANVVVARPGSSTGSILPVDLLASGAVGASAALIILGTASWVRQEQGRRLVASVRRAKPETDGSELTEGQDLRADQPEQGSGGIRT